MRWWQICMAANVVIAGAYWAIAAMVAAPLIETKQLRANRLGTATAAIFFTCGVSHLVHGIHLLGPTLGFAVEEGTAIRRVADLHQAIADGAVAGIAIYYWSLRHTYAPLIRGAKLFDDFKERQRQALEINDNIVQGLTVAHLALVLEDTEMSREALESTLEKARGIISDLLGDVDLKGGRAGTPREVITEGDLIRSRPAIVLEAKSNADRLPPVAR